MSNTWKQTSPGFVYFPKSSISPQKADSSTGFIAFSDPQPSPNKFKPNNYSSPQGKQWGTPKNYYHNRNNQYKQNRYSGQNSSFSPNNSSYNRSNSFNNKYNTSRGDKSFNKNAFVHPSFMENPWAKLEEQLRRKQIQTAEISENSNESSNEET